VSAFFDGAPREGYAADGMFVTVERLRREDDALVETDGNVARIYPDATDTRVPLILSLLFPLRAVLLRPEEAGLEHSFAREPETDLATPRRSYIGDDERCGRGGR
jgi:hypothetical protein